MTNPPFLSPKLCSRPGALGHWWPAEGLGREGMVQTQEDRPSQVDDGQGIG